MIIAFYLAAIYCTVMGLVIWLMPKALIKFNDWLTEKTLLHESVGNLYRFVFGSFFIGIAIIFWWVIFSPQ